MGWWTNDVIYLVARLNNFSYTGVKATRALRDDFVSLIYDLDSCL